MYDPWSHLVDKTEYHLTIIELIHRLLGIIEVDTGVNGNVEENGANRVGP
jgi:hypothetical protein